MISPLTYAIWGLLEPCFEVATRSVEGRIALLEPRSPKVTLDFSKLIVKNNPRVCLNNHSLPLVSLLQFIFQLYLVLFFSSSCQTLSLNSILNTLIAGILSTAHSYKVWSSTFKSSKKFLALLLTRSFDPYFDPLFISYGL